MKQIGSTKDHSESQKELLEVKSTADKTQWKSYKNKGRNIKRLRQKN